MGSEQSDLEMWAGYSATLLTRCPACGDPIAKRGLHTHLGSPECEDSGGVTADARGREVPTA